MTTVENGLTNEECSEIEALAQGYASAGFAGALEYGVTDQGERYASIMRADGLEPLLTVGRERGQYFLYRVADSGPVTICESSEFAEVVAQLPRHIAA